MAAQAKAEVQVDASTAEGEIPPRASLEQKICDTFKEDCDLMIAIAKAESGLNPSAVHYNSNGSIDYGILQVNSIHGEDNLLDVDKNLIVARKIYDTQGITAWSAFNNKSYLKFM